VIKFIKLKIKISLFQNDVYKNIQKKIEKIFFYTKDNFNKELLISIENGFK